MTKIMCPSREEACILSIILILILNAAGADWPNCGFQCKTGDVAVTNMWVGDAQGNPLSSCSPGGQVNAYLWAKIVNNAKSPRYAVILLADIYVNGVLKKSIYADGGLCVLDAISSKASTTLPFYSFTWSCGQQVKIKSLILSWETTRGISCYNANRKCINRDTKCYAGADAEIDVTPPSCQIQGTSPVCETEISLYNLIMTGRPTTNHQLNWMIDGSAANGIISGEGIKVNWLPYGGGYHLLQLTVKWTDSSGELAGSCSSDMKVLVVRVPDAIIVVI